MFETLLTIECPACGADIDLAHENITGEIAVTCPECGTLWIVELVIKEARQ